MLKNIFTLNVKRVPKMGLQEDFFLAILLLSQMPWKIKLCILNPLLPELIAGKKCISRCNIYTCTADLTWTKYSSQPLNAGKSLFR